VKTYGLVLWFHRTKLNATVATSFRKTLQPSMRAMKFSKWLTCGNAGQLFYWDTVFLLLLLPEFCDATASNACMRAFAALNCLLGQPE